MGCRRRHVVVGSVRGARRGDKGSERPMRLGLSHSVKIETCLDPVQTALQPLGVGPVDAGKTIEWGQRHLRRCSAALLSSR